VNDNNESKNQSIIHTDEEYDNLLNKYEEDLEELIKES